MSTIRDNMTRFLSPGALVILIIAIVTSVIVVSLPKDEGVGTPVWVGATDHYKAYRPLIDQWNIDNPNDPINMVHLHASAIERRMLSGFLAGTPVADIIETHFGITAKAFLGPIKDVGFVDLTERLKEEGLLDEINHPSFSPYTSRGHIFGVPHDVHPVLLAYRSDIVEAAGIDVSTIETWDDYFRVMKPLHADRDGDGKPDHYLMTAWETRSDVALMMIMQAGSNLFDHNDRPTMNRPINAKVLANLLTWYAGPNATCADVEAFTASGHRQRLDGVVIGTLVPDWMAGQWKMENPGLSGKVKLMPVPAWTKGGRRTTVAGGSMIGITKKAKDPELAWRLIKYLYFSPKLAEHMFKETNIVSPVKPLWSLPFYDEPDPFFSGQASGRLYLNQAPDVPTRPSSPYASAAGLELGTVTIDLRRYADTHQIYDVESLIPVAQDLLDKAQARVERLIERNQFIRE